jgi:glutamyl/glutaminyl-tRNA synthetase
MNGIYIRNLTLDELYKRTEKFWPASANESDDAQRKKVLALVQDRLKFLGELPELTNFFFEDLPVNPSLWQDHKQLSKVDKNEIKNLLDQAKTTLEKSDFSQDDLTARLNDLLEKTGQKPVILFSLIRIATTQAPFSPGLAETLAVLGKEVALRRIDTMLASL